MLCKWLIVGQSNSNELPDKCQRSGGQVPIECSIEGCSRVGKRDQPRTIAHTTPRPQCTFGEPRAETCCKLIQTPLQEERTASHRPATDGQTYVKRRCRLLGLAWTCKCKSVNGKTSTTAPSSAVHLSSLRPSRPAPKGSTHNCNGDRTSPVRSRAIKHERRGYKYDFMFWGFIFLRIGERFRLGERGLLWVSAEKPGFNG